MKHVFVFSVISLIAIGFAFGLRTKPEARAAAPVTNIVPISCRAPAIPDEPALRSAAGEILADDASNSNTAIATLRAAGSSGLRALLNRYDESKDAKLIPAIEAVAGQRGAAVSRLYWYTDLEQAKAAARAEHKPILYLRLLGKLTDEYSCANSAFPNCCVTVLS
jgi:hypothetical protein